METPHTSGNESDTRYEEFVRLITSNEPGLRRFIASLLPPWGDLEEITQQTAITIWRKFDQYESGTDFMKWACVIARFETLSYKRKVARDRLVFRDDIFEMMADEAQHELETRKKERDALESCLSLLDSQQKDLIILSYTPGEKVKQVAQRAGASAASFYMKIKRLKHKLLRCVEAKLASHEGQS